MEYVNTFFSNILHERSGNNDWTMIIGFTIFYFIVFLLLEFLIFPSFFAPMFPTKPSHEIAVEWNNRITSTMNAVYVSIGGLRTLYYYPHFINQLATSYEPLPSYYFSAFMGYLIYDFLVTVRYHKTLGVTSTYVHHIALFLLPFLGMKYDFLCGLGTFYLLFELTTPFLNQRWFYLKLQNKTILFTLNNLAFVFMFFAVRIVMNVIITVRSISQTVQSGNQRMMILAIFAGVCVLSINCWWFYLIMRGITRVVTLIKGVGNTSEQKKSSTAQGSDGAKKD